MLKSIGLTIVACGVMLGISGAANAAAIPARITNRTTVQTTRVSPHRMTVHRNVHRMHLRRHAGTQGKMSLRNHCVRHGIHNPQRIHHHWYGMV